MFQANVGRQPKARVQRIAFLIGLLVLTVFVEVGNRIANAAQTSPDVRTNNPISGEFFQTFIEPEYLLPMVVNSGGENYGGDLLAQYSQLYFRTDSPHELLLLGEFPNARYFSITIYDDHGAIVDTIRDKDIVPLNADAGNPYAINGPDWNEDQLYAVTIRLGENLATPTPECSTGFNEYDNLLDARYRHSYYTLNPPPNERVYSDFHMGFSVEHPDVGMITHDDGEAASGGVILLRIYGPATETNEGAFNLTKPLMWLRQVADGCPQQLAETGESLPPTCEEGMAPPTDCWYRNTDVMSSSQVYAHRAHEQELEWMSPQGPAVNGVQWYGGSEYMVTSNPHSAYVIASLPVPLMPETLNNEEKVLRIKVRLPQMPAFPCVGTCPFTDEDQVRYWSLTFIGTDLQVLHTFTDRSLVQDENGYATLLLTFGAELDEQIFNAGSGYTVVHMVDDTGAPLPAAQLIIRTVFPGNGFLCSGQEALFHTNENTTAGGYMGEYSPQVDARYPVVGIPGGLPAIATPLQHIPLISCIGNSAD